MQIFWINVIYILQKMGDHEFLIDCFCYPWVVATSRFRAIEKKQISKNIRQILKICQESNIYITEICLPNHAVLTDGPIIFLNWLKSLLFVHRFLVLYLLCLVYGIRITLRCTTWTKNSMEGHIPWHYGNIFFISL